MSTGNGDPEDDSFGWNCVARHKGDERENGDNDDITRLVWVLARLNNEKLLARVGSLRFHVSESLDAEHEQEEKPCPAIS